VARLHTALTGTDDLAIKHTAATHRLTFDRDNLAGNDYNHQGGPADLEPHVFGIGFTSGSLAFATDSARLASTRTTPTDDVVNRFKLGFDGSTSASGNVEIAQAVVAKGEPDEQQVAAVRAWLAARWGLPETPLSTGEVFDLAELDPDFTHGNFGGAENIDGTVYLAPWCNGDHTKIASWDTSQPFALATSWSVTDLSAVAGPNGFAGSCTDGRYLFLSPINYNMVRIDTWGDPSDPGSIDTKDLRDVNPLHGGTSAGCIVADGHMYVVPLFADDDRGHVVVRYETSQDYSANSSWEAFDIANLDPDCSGFLGADTDGRYVYLGPYAKNGITHGCFVRYDMQSSYQSTSSWQSVHLTDLDPALKGFGGVTVAGDFVYLVPGEVSYNLGDGHIGASYDRSLDFESLSSYRTFDFHDVEPTAEGFMLARYDAVRYLYYPQEHAGVSKPAVVRFDTWGDYEDPASYTFLDVHYWGAGYSGFAGAALVGPDKVIAPLYSSYTLLMGSAF
jgi:hypothetical protein